MTSEQASTVKISGHVNEAHFAELIGGHVQRGSHKDKKDVADKKDRFHSVKAGARWQIFLYSKSRLETNTIFQGLGNIASIMIACIDAYPATWEEYLADKMAAKLRLQPHMRSLLEELKKPRMLASFFDKALFDGGNADYLSIYPGSARDPIDRKHFHVFHKKQVVETLCSNLLLCNSKARNRNQMDDQKVVFVSLMHSKQIGQIEDRHDSNGHYRQMKFRLDGNPVYEILKSKIQPKKNIHPQVTAYGTACQWL
ncbi:MAG: hypothetical protein GDA45_02365 [Chromatiales bacterium]|nr:hypothetical protein [Chromatiales bacterium]